MLSHLGELAALATTIGLTVGAIAYESAGKKVGSLSVSFIRLFITFTMSGVCAFFVRGIVFPVDADLHTWAWFAMSGLIGCALGDMCLFKAYVEIGPRITLLIMSAAPPLTALMGFFILGERVSIRGLTGMVITMAGICLVILSRDPDDEMVRLNRPVRGIVCACMGALGQASSFIFNKIGIGSYNPFAAMQIRLLAAIVGFVAIISIRRKWPEIRAALGDRSALKVIMLGSVFGSFIGMTCSLVAVKYTAAGIASSISSISPVIIIPISIMVFKEKVLLREIFGALVSIIGVVLLFW
jgi:drug/metabolite transporter (DMT)-like permease